MSKNHFHRRNPNTAMAPWALAQPTNKPTLIRPKAKPHSTQQDANIKSVHANDAQRHQVEHFIQDIFKKHHGAEVHEFAPSLLAIFNQNNEVDAALGYRLAGQGPLFLELYLDQPIESLVSHYLGQHIERHSIGETGNLASSNATSCKALFAHTVDYLHDKGIDWFVSTGTGVMRVVYRRLGIQAHVIHDVDKTRLSEEQQAAWGRFYEDKPKILLINVAQAKRRFNEMATQQSQKEPH